MPRTRRAAAAAAAAKRKGQRQSLRITDAATDNASGDEQLLEKLEAYRRDLESQFQQHVERLQRRLQKEHNAFNTTFSLSLSRLSGETRRMLFVDYLANEVGLQGVGGTAVPVAEERVAQDQNDVISERVKRSVRRKPTANSAAKRPAATALSATVAASASSRKRAALDPVMEENEAPSGMVRGKAGVPRRLRGAAANTPLTVSTPLTARTENRKVTPLAASVGATTGRLRSTRTTASKTVGGRRLVREREDAFSQGGSPLINPFDLRHEDLQKLKRNELSQLKRLKSRLDELLQRV